MNKALIIAGSILAVLTVSLCVVWQGERTETALLRQEIAHQQELLQTQINLGGVGSRYTRLFKSASATSTQTYLGVGGTMTATTTILTAGCTGTSVNVTDNVRDADTLALYVQAVASSSASTIYIQPQVSNDCVDWYNMGVGSLYTQITTMQGGQGPITQSVASGTILQLTPGQAGQVGHQFVMEKLIASAVRFRVWATNASSSVYAEAAVPIRETR